MLSYKRGATSESLQAFACLKPLPAPRAQPLHAGPDTARTSRRRGRLRRAAGNPRPPSSTGTRRRQCSRKERRLAADEWLKTEHVRSGRNTSRNASSRSSRPAPTSSNDLPSLCSRPCGNKVDPGVSSAAWISTMIKRSSDAWTMNCDQRSTKRAVASPPGPPNSEGGRDRFLPGRARYRRSSATSVPLSSITGTVLENPFPICRVFW